MKRLSWVVYPNKRKQISLIKIPKDIVAELNIRDGTPISILITGKANRNYFRGPVTVTSGCEIYIPNNVKNILRNLKEFRIVIL